MMSKILFIPLLLSSFAFAQDGSEEAIILNQELQFLEDAANNVSISRTSQTSPTTISAAQDRAQPIDTRSLESRYFGNDEDTIQTRAAAPRRKRSIAE